MRNGADDEAGRTISPDLGALRARLYAPDSTPADRAAYDAAVAEATGRTRRSEATPPARDAPAGQPDPETPPAPAQAPRRLRPLTVGLLAVALLAVGAGIGVGASSIATGPAAAASPSSSPRAAAGRNVPLLPTPVAARALPMRAATRTATTAALAKILATGTDESAVSRAVERIGADISDPDTDGAWMTRHACSSSNGIVRASTRGRPVVLTPAVSALRLPAHAHFRIVVYLTRPAGWSWVVSSARGAAASAPIAVGAGSPEAGTVQYAEFDGDGTGDLTRVEVASTGGTPFLWQLDSCITGA